MKLGMKIGDRLFKGFSVYAQEIVTRGKLGLAQNIVAGQIQQAEQEFASPGYAGSQRREAPILRSAAGPKYAMELNQEMERLSGVAANTASDLFKASEVGRKAMCCKPESSSIWFNCQSIKARNAAQESAWRRLAVVVRFALELQIRPLAGDLRQRYFPTTSNGTNSGPNCNRVVQSFRLRKSQSRCAQATVQKALLPDPLPELGSGSRISPTTIPRASTPAASPCQYRFRYTTATDAAIRQAQAEIHRQQKPKSTGLHSTYEIDLLR